MAAKKSDISEAVEANKAVESVEAVEATETVEAVESVESVESVEATETVEAVETVEAFVLRDCGFGDSGEVVLLPLADATVGAAHGMLDLHPEAVKAAKVAIKAEAEAKAA
jgi:hypothetical protein